jgi:hypothetical protein
MEAEPSGCEAAGRKGRSGAVLVYIIRCLRLKEELKLD